MNYGILKSIIYTEKSSKGLVDRKYYFKIDSRFNKSDVKSFVTNMFGVDVLKVNVSNFEGKTKRFKGVAGKRKSYKKAVVTLKEGQSINFQNLK